MRLFIAAMVVCHPAVVWAEELRLSAENTQDFAETQQFQLGGAATRTIQAREAPAETDSPPRLSLPISTPSQEVLTVREGSLGAATVFMSEGLDAGRDSFELGTFLRRGQARAGVSVTYLEEDAQLARSEVFVDYALTERFSIGLSGILDSELDDSEPIRQFGLSAEYSTSQGAFVQGGVAGAADYDPVIGLSVGLRF